MDIVARMITGQLSEEQNEALRIHIAGCNDCQLSLAYHMELYARMEHSTDVIDDLINTINSLEQQAVFTLLNEGITFAKMQLYRELEPMEQGIMVVNSAGVWEKVCVISVKWPPISELLVYRDRTAQVTIELKYLGAFSYLNK